MFGDKALTVWAHICVTLAVSIPNKQEYTVFVLMSAKPPHELLV